MNVAGTHTFNAPPEAVWRLLLDPQVIAAVIPGCHQVRQTAVHQYKGNMTFQAGPMRGSFEGTLHLTQLKEPEQFQLAATAQGPTGSLTGNGTIHLVGENGRTTLHYEGDADISGDIQAAGPRLLGTASRAIIRQSLANLEAALEGHNQPAPAPTQTQFLLNVAKTFVEEAAPPPKRSAIAALLAAVTATFGLLYLWQRLSRRADRLTR